MSTPATPIAGFGERQQRLLTLLLEKKQGQSADELARALEISRSAVHQHLTVLSGAGYVEKTPQAPKGGRPGFAWRLSERGVHLFPKHYALFAELLLGGMKGSLGSEGLSESMQRMGRLLGEQNLHRMKGRTPAERIEEVARIMRELGYQSRTEADESGGAPMIDARNCIWHDLARRHREVCELDIALMETLLGEEVEHTECMVRGGTACRFRIHPRKRGG
ncbi:MAG TPA: HTH domain-containing protein [Woeseiaceae bacterium]|nr:HTH domain-containing protein [Woeseiaceae bacterium]